ncbi:hypothetical protein [Streptomyces silvisoli]|uniref:Uncharacterized protein n=1 Tax=Streptomyces silvisoli TaxID=3034235 RepID=A0ABT5ZDV2_9ACTN|nr:hypothetical protein [Streptomyces silvisoli]MDF3288001.1 hypothetical protein [Streptomyces silvisoli]
MSTARRPRLPLAVAGLLLTAVPLLAPADPATACDAPDPAPSATRTPATVHHGRATAAYDPLAMPKGVIAGGPKVEIGTVIYNGTGAPFHSIRPALGLSAWAPIGNGKAVSLAPRDATVEVYHQGRWKRLSLTSGCDPVLNTNTDFLAENLPDNRATRFLFRLSIAPAAPAQLTSLQVHFTAWSERGYEALVSRTIPITR